MLTNGVDPYNGSTSVMNQGSPYVDNAIADAQRAGVAVYAIYFGDAGISGGSADISGQDYLSQITQATGGVNLWEGVGNPVSTAPFLSKFQSALAETYIATFNAPLGNNPGARPGSRQVHRRQDQTPRPRKGPPRQRGIIPRRSVRTGLGSKQNESFCSPESFPPPDRKTPRSESISAPGSLCVFCAEGAFRHTRRY